MYVDTRYARLGEIKSMANNCIRAWPSIHSMRKINNYHIYDCSEFSASVLPTSSGPTVVCGPLNVFLAWSA